MKSFVRRLLTAIPFNEVRKPIRRPGKTVQLKMTALEDRLTPSWTSIPPTSIFPLGSVDVSLNSLGDASGSSVVSSNEVDFYSFIAPTAGTYRFSTSGSIDTVLGIYQNNGSLLAYNDDANGTLQSTVAVNLAAGNRYYFGITNFVGTSNGFYGWFVDGPSQPVAIDDGFENNDTQGSATSLGTLNSNVSLSNLVSNDSDWFSFTMTGTGNAGSQITTSFNHAFGDIDVTLHNSSGSVIGSSEGVGNVETISLNGYSPGTYFVHVFGYAGARNPNYNLSISPAVGSVATDDAFEENDTFAQARDFGVVSGVRTTPNLVMADSGDWFKFTTAGGSTSAHSVQIGSSSPEGDLDLFLYSALGGTISSSTSPSNSEAITLNGLGAGTYYVQVIGWNGTRNPNYTLTVTAPATSSDDIYEENDSLGAAANLGTIAGDRVINGLRMADAADWFRFTINSPGIAGNAVRLASSTGGTDLDLTLFNSAGNQIAISESPTNTESISLQGLAAGTYSVRVVDFNNTNQGVYTLTVAAPTGSVPPPAAKSVLYLNFDGATISRNDLNRWAGSDWRGSLNFLDADNNGITVQPFLNGNSSRTAIINRMMQLVQEDLNPFGITVQRTTGLAVENQGRTTIFLGRSSLPSNTPHVASDVDYGNNNRTDIAFVGDETWGTVERTALAMADVTLHEAGHTYGLYHVNSGTATESMGLRYSTPQSSWVQNTSFQNASHAEYSKDGLNHGGGRGPQNSFARMFAAFVSTNLNPEAEPESQEESTKVEDFPIVNLDTLPTNGGAIATSFTRSRERFESIVRQNYQQFLGRAPDPAGLQHWVGLLESGALSRERVDAAFIGSVEYVSRFANSADWVRSMYQDLLGRTPSQQEVNHWTQTLLNGATTADVAFGFAASRERLGYRVAEYYQTYLGRTAALSEINHWVDAFANGLRDDQLIAGFVGSEEYYFNQDKGKGRHGSWVTQLYSDVLHRSVSSNEIAGWVNVIQVD